MDKSCNNCQHQNNDPNNNKYCKYLERNEPLTNCTSNDYKYWDPIQEEVMPEISEELFEKMWVFEQIKAMIKPE